MLAHVHDRSTFRQIPVIIMVSSSNSCIEIFGAVSSLYASAQRSTTHRNTSVS